VSEGEPAAPAPSPYEAQLRDRFPSAVQEVTWSVDFPVFAVDPAQIIPICRFVKEDLGFRMPALLSGVDRLDHMEVVYHLYHMERREFVGLLVKLSRDDPRVDSVTGVWRGMDWHEREAFDLLGILFEGHPDLRRILLPEDWEGHPLRKDYTEID
jgi:NADH-quinone oxidoreductase subunit C